MPHKCVQPLMLFLGFASLALSIVTYVLCILVFGQFAQDSVSRTTLFILIMVKAGTWSPFLGMEYYDMIFEHLYHDVQF